MPKSLWFITIIWLCIASCFSDSPHNGHPSYFNTFFTSADSLASLKEYEKAIQILDSAYFNFPAPDISDRIKVLAYTSNLMYFKLEDHMDLIQRVDTLLNITKEFPDIYGESYVDALYLKGNILIAMNDYLLGSQYLQKAYQFTKKYLDICQKSRYHDHLAKLLFQQSKYKQGITQYKIYLNEIKNCPEEPKNKFFANYQATLNSIGFGYEKMEQFDSASHYYLKAIDFIDSSRIEPTIDSVSIITARSVAIGNLGGIYLRQEKYEEALPLLDESIQNNGRFKEYEMDVCLTRIKRARVYLRTSDWRAAETEVPYIDSCAKHMTELDHRFRYFRFKWEFADAQKDTAAAYQYHLQMQKLNAEINRIIFEKAQIDFQQVLQNYNQEDELVQLRAANKQKTIYIILAALLVCMSIIIIFLYRRNNIQSRQNMQQLSKLNQDLLKKTEQLQKTLFDLQESQEENTQMMKIVAHDLRNPISAIVQITQIIQMDNTIPADQMAFVLMIQNSAKDSLDFINDLLHVNTSFDNIKKEEIEISNVLMNSVELLNFKAREKYQQIHFTAIEAICLANREKIWRVFNNLLSNAIKFSPKGAEIFVDMKYSDKKVTCSVSDSGIGIPNNLKHQIFDIFTEAGRTGTSGEQSFGLGLAISKQIIEAHQGHIWFESDINKGTTFFVELPMAN